LLRQLKFTVDSTFLYGLGNGGRDSLTAPLEDFRKKGAIIDKIIISAEEQLGILDVMNLRS
jgi:hypothetical protein